ncbi:L-rhamnose isomerase [Dinoroseobacter shibae DFL 12 = DSM 16493]|uniref:L-rhamnose isomerase n=1 Tax=Dinoroseobacter shibae (strain DSM 16493 / NCIMB 14021 / DFL 12) TaxID=398580 RepID=A8LS78_DINSH|nr:L-rhamnose isomerase [Dinoroseobacter shibae]ABV94171.1 L-rhamnose isomerase [Dinoroseobacter shibae DFL 12 = DSM 16493]URF45612.1 L-rhamnose isomerase [Dinoroseobacter shibae]URF49917.1 L-rhamnose isomerase [Dinoroseobacter shibae]
MGYENAKAAFAEWGVDTEAALARLKTIPISMHCWQGDDVVGFEQKTGSSGGGIQATGNHPGRARTPDELRADLEFAYAMIPGRHRLNLHAMYLDTEATPDRDEIEIAHFAPWVDWARAQGIGLDFNPTFFAHAKADDNLTLSHPDPGIRDFWIEHGKRSREIAAGMGAALGSACVNNIWVPDGYKDTPVDRMAARARLEASLDAMLAPPQDRARMLDAVESKLFGIGVEACTVGSHEFYMGYAIRKGTLLCLDMGHFHPTENIADKLSAVALSLDEILLHVSRPMRWDSDHVILLDDDILQMAQELVSADLLGRTRIGLDFFDATISRTAAWVIGTRNMQKALLRALLMPLDRLRAAEDALDFTTRLVVTEEVKDLPFGAVWAEFAAREDVPNGQKLIRELDRYQAQVSGRG